jgi:hypothetical protein
MPSDGDGTSPPIAIPVGHTGFNHSQFQVRGRHTPPALMNAALRAARHAWLYRPHSGMASAGTQDKARIGSVEVSGNAGSFPSM